MINLIKGGIASDQRGSIRFVNDFDMSLIKRFYIISNADTELVRGWRAHRIEQRWFYVLSGSFSMDTLKIENWENPSKDTPVQKQTLKASDLQVIHVPAGYATAFQALDPNSQILVFADHNIEHVSLDDYTYPLDYFVNRL